jgi:hypothetical protein
MTRKLQTIVKQLLIEQPHLRDNDRALVWSVWEHIGLADHTYILYADFMDKSTPSSDSITRCRRKVQEENPELQASDDVKTFRLEREKLKGQDVLHEKVRVIGSLADYTVSYKGKK